MSDNRRMFKTGFQPINKMQLNVGGVSVIFEMTDKGEFHVKHKGTPTAAAKLVFTALEGYVREVIEAEYERKKK